jgi:hypothetical protein
VVAPPSRFDAFHVALIGNWKLFDDDAVAGWPLRYLRICTLSVEVAVGGVVVPAHVSFHTTTYWFPKRFQKLGLVLESVLDAAAAKLDVALL